MESAAAANWPVYPEPGMWRSPSHCSAVTLASALKDEQKSAFRFDIGSFCAESHLDAVSRVKSLILSPEGDLTFQPGASHMNDAPSAPLLPNDDTTSSAPEVFPQPTGARWTSSYEDGKWTASVTYPIGQPRTPTPPSPASAPHPHDAVASTAGLASFIVAAAAAGWAISFRESSSWYQLVFAIDLGAAILLLAILYFVDPGIVPPSTIKGMG